MSTRRRAVANVDPPASRRSIPSSRHGAREALEPKPVLELRNAGAELARVGEVPAADVRGGDDGACSVADCEPRQLQAVLHRRRAVVDARERMEVNICTPWLDSVHGLR